MIGDSIGSPIVLAPPNDDFGDVGTNVPTGRRRALFEAT
jgi:hypothetical protein